MFPKTMIQGRLLFGRFALLIRRTSVGVLLAGATSLFLLPFESRAQDTAASDETPAAQEQETTEELDEIVVLGSQIKGLDMTGTLPISVLTREEMDVVGAVEAEELLRSLPQAGAAQFNANNNAGGVNQARGDIASVNLRSIGTGNTLMLVNGRRMVFHPGFHNEDGVPVVSPNMNAIPVSALQRLEVMRDGAAALYGADAVAGVINNVLRNDFEGLTFQTRYGLAEQTNRYDYSANFMAGFDFNGGKSHIGIFGDYSYRTDVNTDQLERTASSDRRPFLIGTPFEGDRQFDNNSSIGAFGRFETASGDPIFLTNGARITNSGGRFHIAPDTNSGCRFDIGAGLCIDDGNPSSTSDRNLFYDVGANRQIVPERERYNLHSLFSHDFGDLEFYAEAGGYYAKTDRLSESPRVLSTARMVIPSSNYWNPFGATLLNNGDVNPNRLAGVNIPAEGLDIVLYHMRLVDAGQRRGIVTNKSYRVLSGVRGSWADWDFDTAFLYSKSISEDITKNGVSSTLLQQALALNTPDAYNPFNGGGSVANGHVSDLTPNPPSVIDSIRGDVTKTGETSLALADFKVSNAELFNLPGGSAGTAFGVEFRRETFLDDRGPRLDGTTPFVDLVTGVVSQSDALGNSPTNDSSGSRDVFSLYAELIAPMVSEEMDIPLVNDLTVQLAARYEDFSDGYDVLKPRVAVSWSLVPGLAIRSAWSEGFRAPNLIQLNDTGLSRINTVVDFTRCQAQVEKGIFANESDCAGTRIERVSSGSSTLQPEDSENISFGLVIAPTLYPNFVFTADFWRVEQDDLVGLFGVGNQSQLDRVLRLDGTSNGNVVREAPTDEDIILYTGTSFTPVGVISRIFDPYQNLDTRTVEGVDFSIDYTRDTNIGEFNFTFDASRLLRFDQESGNEGKLLEDRGVVTTRIGDLIEQNGKPVWKYSTRLMWHKGNWRSALYGRYVGSFDDTSVSRTDSLGEEVFWRIESHFNLSATVDYYIKEGSLDGTRIRLGVKNVFDELPPLADERYGFFHKLHNITGRYAYLDIRHKF